MNPLRLVIISDLENVVVVGSRLERVILEIGRLFSPVGHDLKEKPKQTGASMLNWRSSIPSLLSLSNKLYTRQNTGETISITGRRPSRTDETSRIRRIWP